jgi:hypothetical protein
MSGSIEVALDGEVNMLNAGSSASYGLSKVTLASAVDVCLHLQQGRGSVVMEISMSAPVSASTADIRPGDT